MSTSYDLWKFRGDDDYDAEIEARDEWESDLDIIEAFGKDEVEDLLVSALTNEDIRPRVIKLRDKAWEKEKQNRLECSYDY